MKALRIFCLGGLLLLYAQVGMGQDSIRTEHLQEVKVNARQHRILTSTSPLQLLDKGDMLRLGVTDMADALHRMPGINLRDYGGAGGMKTVAVRGFGAGHTGVSYDGVLLSECQGGEIDVSRYSLDQVQTLRLTIGDNDDIFISARQASVAALLAIETMSEIPIDQQPHFSTQLQVGSASDMSRLICAMCRDCLIGSLSRRWVSTPMPKTTILSSCTMVNILPMSEEPTVV